MKVKSTNLSILLFLFTLSITGQDKNKLLVLDETDISAETGGGKTKVLSASRTIENLEDIPVTVYVITREEILKNGYSSLVDVLKDVPGIKASRPGSGVDGEKFSMRGLIGNYYAKILINDIPVRPSVVSGMPIADQIPVRQAERIEVIVGPASSVYGADALAGVVNIITKTSERPVWGQADISLGNFGYSNINAMIGGKVGKNKNILKYSFFGSFAKLEDMNIKYDIQNVYNPAIYDSTYSFLQQPNYKGDSTEPLMNKLPQMSGNVGFSLSYRDFTFSFFKMWRQDHSSLGQKTNVYTYYDPTIYWGEDIQRYSLVYSKNNARLSNKTTLSYLRYRLDNNSSFRMIFDAGDRGKLYKYAASDDIFLDEVLSFGILKNLSVTGGVSLQLSGNLPKTNDLAYPFDEKLYSPFADNIDFNDPVLGNFGINPVNYFNAGGFLQLFYKSGKFRFYLGDRYDYNSLYGGKNNPRLALLFKPEKNLSFRTSFGTAYLTPSPYFTFNSVAYQTGNGIYYRNIPNTGLEPERFYEAEIGLRYNYKDLFYLDIAAYYHLLDKQITNTLVYLDTTFYPNAVNEDNITFAYVNDENSKSRLFGIQTNLRFRNIIKPVKLNSDLFISYAKGMEILPGGLGELDDYRQMPRWMIQLNFNFSLWKPLQFIFQNTVSSKWAKGFFPLPPEYMKILGLKTYVNGFYNLNFITQFKVSKNLNAFFRLNNAFNSHYGGIDAYGNSNDLVYNPQYGRNFVLGFIFRME